MTGLQAAAVFLDKCHGQVSASLPAYVLQDEEKPRHPGSQHLQGSGSHCPHHASSKPAITKPHAYACLQA